jgi:hypothetical protein
MRERNPGDLYDARYRSMRRSLAGKEPFSIMYRPEVFHHHRAGMAAMLAWPRYTSALYSIRCLPVEDASPANPRAPGVAVVNLSESQCLFGASCSTSRGREALYGTDIASAGYRT